MKRPVAIGLTILAIALSSGTPTAAGAEGFAALSKVQGASRLSTQELSEVEGSALIFGSINTPLYYESISAFLHEVLLTLYGIGGRSPIVTHTTVSAVFTPLPGGGITVGIQPNTFILVKNMICVGCSRP